MGVTIKVMPNGNGGAPLNQGFSAGEIENLRVGQRLSNTFPSNGDHAFNVEGFQNENASAVIYLAAPDRCYYTVQHHAIRCSSPEVFATPEQALVDLKQWLKGLGFIALYDESLPDYLLGRISHHMLLAVENGFRSILVTRIDLSNSDDPELIRAAVAVTLPNGARTSDTFGVFDAAEVLQTLFRV